MRQFIAVLLIIATVLIALSFSVSAHSGGTDSNGGHYNHSTGEYHYHHGQPAHSHPDGVCPYEQNDNGMVKIIIRILIFVCIGVVIYIFIKKKI